MRDEANHLFVIHRSVCHCITPSLHHRCMVGKSLSYVDLSMFQLIAGLDYAFPRTLARMKPAHPKLVSLHGRVMERPRIAAYLASPRRIPFNQLGIFRHYPELDEG